MIFKRATPDTGSGSLIPDRGGFAIDLTLPGARISARITVASARSLGLIKVASKAISLAY